MRWVLRLSALAAVAFFAACSSERTSERDGAAFVFGRGSDAQKLDPADVDDGESVNTLAQICEGLVRFKSGGLEVEPCLAESYSISPDGLSYRFKIREGARFHDGAPLDAEAAAYSFRRQMGPEHPGHLAESAYSYWNYLYQDIEAVTVLSPMELEIRLARPNASMLRSLAIFPAFLVSPRSAALGLAMQRRPIGTGPYRFVEWRPGEAIVLERNDDYWGTPPALERLIFKVVPDNGARLLQLKAGAIHGMDGLQPADAASLRADPAIDLYQDAGLNVCYLAFNLETPRAAELEIRQAIALAIDKERFAAVALEGAGRPATHPIPPGMLGYPENDDADVQDLERARALLAPHREALAREPLTLRVMNAPRPYLPDPAAAAGYLKWQLEQVGLEVRVVTSDFKSHLDALRNGDFELGLIGWVGDNGDPDNFLSVFFGSWAAEKGAATNYSFYRSEEMDTLLLAARREPDEAARARLYAEALRLCRRDLPILPLCHGDNIVAIRAEFGGFTLQRSSDLRLDGLHLR